MTVPANVYASLPAVPTEGQYRMGPSLISDVTDIWLNTTLPDGTLIAVGEPDGWNGLHFLTPIDQAGGRDGGLVGPQSVAPRILPVSGLMVSPDPATLWNNIRRMRTLLGPRTTVVWEQHDFGVGVRQGMVCRAQGDFKAVPTMGHQRGGVAAPFSFTLVAANPPWKLSVGTALQACTGLSAGATNGRTYNKTYNWNYGAFTVPGGTMNINNAGDLNAWPVFTITGPVDTPVITNDTTGATFTISAVVPAGVTVTVDSRTGVVNPSNYRLIGRPFPLAPGNNSLRWRSTTGVYDPAALFCVSWRSTWE